MTRFGVIDLGTNTFHLLIVEVDTTGNSTELYRERIFVKLAEDGINKIGENAYQRGLLSLQHFQKETTRISSQKFKSFCEHAALRTASNGNNFIEDAKLNSNIEIQLIPGSEEARLIHIGVTQAVELV